MASPLHSEQPIDAGPTNGWSRYWPWLLKAALLFCLLPFLVLSFFNQPVYDDYVNAARTALHGVWGVQKYLYLSWTGRYFSTLLLTLTNPLSYGWVDGVRYTPFLFMVLIWGSLFLLIRWLLQGTPARRYSAWLAAALLLIYLYAMPQVFQGFFWYTGGAVYQVGNVLLITALLVSYRVLTAATTGARIGWIALCVLIVAAASATNEVVLIQLLVTFGMCFLASVYQKNRAWRWWVTITLVTLATAMVALAAPGNFARMASEHPANAQSIVYAVPRSVFSMLDVVSRIHNLNSLLLILLLWLPIGTRIVKAGRLPFLRMHPLLSVGAICAVVALCYFPFWWIWAAYTPVRTENAIVFFLLVAWLVAVQATLGWMHARQYSLPTLPTWAYAYAVPVFGLLVVFRAAALMAWLDLGLTARTFERVHRERRASIEQQISAGRQDLVVEPMPLARVFGILTDGSDLTVNAKDGPNTSLAAYHRVRSIRLSHKSPLIQEPTPQ